jgi:hypothetical protein
VVVDGRVVDADGAPIDGAEVSLFSPDGISAGTAPTDATGAWAMPVYGTELLGNAFVAIVTADGYAEGRATFDVNLRAPETHPLNAGPLQTWDTTARQLAAIRLAAEAVEGRVDGRLLHAVTGEPVGGVALSLQQGWNARASDPVLAQTSTDLDGAFDFAAVTPGVYTVTATAVDATGPARFPVFLTGDGADAVGVVGPPTAPGEFRASLTWGPGVADLDLHLTAPLRGGQAGVDGNGRYHVWSGSPRHPQREETDPEARLERADSDGEGPESAWAREPGVGELHVTAFDADNPSDPGSTALAGTNAVLQTWWGDAEPSYFTVAGGETAVLWRPLELDVMEGVPYAVEQYATEGASDDPEIF